MAKKGIKAHSIEGLPQGAWVLIDFGDVICHIFHQDMRGYYDHLRAFVDHAVGEAFLQSPHRDMIIFRDDPVAILDAFFAYSPPAVEKWIGRPEL